jgi:hypothetical protein
MTTVSSTGSAEQTCEIADSTYELVGIISNMAKARLPGLVNSDCAPAFSVGTAALGQLAQLCRVGFGYHPRHRGRDGLAALASP